jgi:hypothetical protein
VLGNLVVNIMTEDDRIKCNRCDAVAEVSSSGYWHALPPGWMVGPPVIRDTRDIFVCSRACAESFDVGTALWEEYERLGGYYPRARWRHDMAAAKMLAKHGASWVDRLNPEDRETFAERETPGNWVNAPERPAASAVVRQFVETDPRKRRDVCFCEWCLVEWVSRHDCPSAGLACALQYSMEAPVEMVELPILESRYAFMVAKEA